MARRLVTALVLALGMAGSCLGPAAAVTAVADPLPAVEQQIAKQLHAHATTFEIALGPVPFKSVEPAFLAALAEDEYVEQDYRSMAWDGVSSGDAETVTFHVQYWEDAAQYAYVMAKLRAMVGTLTTTSMTDVGKEKAIHDYMVLHLAYDGSQTHRSPYDALKLGITVCQGYAMIAYQMLKDAGIAVRLLTGGSHAWNLVQVGGHWYHLDVTWDDPYPDQPGKVSYAYFNLSD